MDVFIEKIVKKKKSTEDSLITAGIIAGGFILAVIIIPLIPLVNSFGIFFDAAIIYFAYYFITSLNVEYEYAVTNGDLDIDKIVSKRKRKRLFSANCKDFEILARVKSSHYTRDIQSIPKKIAAVSSIDSPDAFFATLNYKGEKTVIVFEPDARMLDIFKTYIPRKIFME